VKVSEPQRVIVYLDSWAGRTGVPADLLGVTRTRYRVRWRESALGRRKGAVGLVPKHAVQPLFGEVLPIMERADAG
jgi:hypothetical protein